MREHKNYTLLFYSITTI